MNNKMNNALESALFIRLCLVDFGIAVPYLLSYPFMYCTYLS